MGHLVVFNTWGYIVTFGVFQAYYESTLGVSASAISWVGCHEDPDELQKHPDTKDRVKEARV
jgi:hypothetical protein